jgi:hypothetical protein
LPRVKGLLEITDHRGPGRGREKLSSADLKKLSAELKKDTGTKEALVAIGAPKKVEQELAKDSKALAEAVKNKPDI